ncbi:MAG TPA: hypothetical protein PLP17_13730, partial [Oligoflexia bacterium]|nr:hypothetical protein [Oligoflexia bacterium]
MGNFYRQLEYVLMRNTTMLVLHIIAVCAAIIILPRVALWLLFCLNAVFFVVIIEYGQVFNRPLSWGIITHQAQDLWGVLTPDVQWINQKTFLLVVAGVLIKFLLSRFYAPGALFSKKQRLVFGVVCCVSWAILFVWTATVYGFHKDPTAKNRNLPPEKLAPIIGYLPAWLLDAVTIRNEQHLAEAVAHADTGESRLIGAEAMFPVPPRIAAIQVESLDWDSLSLVYEGQEVVPNFRKISQEAMLYKVVSLHHNGSVDMDFAFLTRREPSRNVVNYRIIGFPYDNSTVELAEQMGYETVALHNHSGESFHRRYAFSKMGFDNMVFAEEMRRLFPVHRV